MFNMYVMHLVLQIISTYLRGKNFCEFIFVTLCIGDFSIEITGKLTNVLYFDLELALLRPHREQLIRMIVYGIGVTSVMETILLGHSSKSFFHFPKMR